MTNEAIPVPLNEKEAKLMTAIADELMQRSINITPGSCMYFAGYLARRVVAEGWQWHPPKLEPEQEIEMMDRIISGLPMVPAGVELYDVNSLYPQEYLVPMNADGNAVYKKAPEQEPTWSRIPEFENYEVNQLGIVRSRWTRRDLEVILIGDERYVEMHDKDGFPHNVNIRLVMEWTYGK